MKNIFITGGSGTVGSSFIELYQDQYNFFSFSRNEKMQVSLKRRFRDVNIILGSVEDKLTLQTSIAKVKPDIIIHAAAMKHVDSGEFSPIQTIKSNIVGSLNVIDTAIHNKVPLTIAISSDKACCPDNNYGYTKALMEKMFIEAHTKLNKFSVCRFGNVSHSHGSVIPYWLRLKADKKPIPLTDKSMNRLMFTRQEAAKLVHVAMQKAQNEDKSFVLSQAIKSVNMLKLAKIISDDVVTVGLRPGEKLNETLINNKEVPNTFLESDYIIIRDYANKGNNKLDDYYSSANAEFMTDKEMLSLITDTNQGLKKTLLESKIY